MKILSYDPTLRLPTAEELPDSDDTPVDHELQNLIPNAADGIISRIWAQRDDWFWGINMGIYYHPEKPALVPDGFLSIGVQRIKSTDLRPSYVVWEEKGIVPILVMEVASNTDAGEYDKKMAEYAELGPLYYGIYNPFCGPSASGHHADHQPLELYKLEGDQYRLLSGNPIWLPEIGLGIGTKLGKYRGRSREWVYWYDQEGRRYLTSDELADRARQWADRVQQDEMELERQWGADQVQQQVELERQWADQVQQQVELERQRAQQELEQERQRAQQAQQRAERLAEYLRSQNIDPDKLM